MTARLLLLALGAAAIPSASAAADRNYSVTDFNRIKLNGPFKVRLATGVSPFAKASGSPDALNDIKVEVQGRTLIIGKNPSSWGGYPGESRGPVEISVGTHGLTNAWVNGSGSLDIDKARGASLELTLVGAGSIGVGRVEVDRLNFGVAGSGSARIAGEAKQSAVVVRGNASFDGSQLQVKNATVGAEGAAVVKLAVKDTVKIDTQGTATVDISGKPACTVRASGSSEVSGCR